MGYDNVLKDVKKREKAERKVALIKKTEEATITRDEIYKILPLHEEEALSLADLKSHFPEKLNDHISANACSLFNSGRIKRIKRYDNPMTPSVAHCYYWKNTEAKEKGIPSIHGMYKPLEEETTLREKIFNEIPTNCASAITHNDICKRKGCKPNDSGIASSLNFLYTLNFIKRDKRGRLFHYWRDADNRVYTDLRDGDRKKTNQSTRDFLLDVLPCHTSPVRISVRTLIIRGGGKYTKDAIESSLQKLLKNQKIVRAWDGKRFLYQHAGPNGNLKLEQIKTVSPSQPLIEESFNKHLSERKVSVLPSPIPSILTEELLTKYKADNKKLDERILNIEKQIEDLGQKQELQTEMQKREENEKRLAELEDQLHKIVIADTSVKRGILH